MRGAAAAAAFLAAAVQVSLCGANCDAGLIDVEVGGKAANVSVPALVNDQVFTYNCSRIHAGYNGLIEVHCVGYSSKAYSHGCGPNPCTQGQRLSARVSPDLAVEVSLPVRLDHGAEWRVACVDLLQGYQGRIRLECQMGTLKADASNCHREVAGVRPLWRVLNDDVVSGAWHVYELSFYTSPDCTDGRITGDVFASSEDYAGLMTHDQAFDGDPGTNWAAGCERGCLPGVAWLGIGIEGNDERLRCMRLLQSDQEDSPSVSRHVRLEVWDGFTWQFLQAWDTMQLGRYDDGHELRISVTCESRKPQGAGIVHDCDGIPVVGRQEGESCTASCGPGYYGGIGRYTCGADGGFSGQGPTCFHEVTMGYVFGGVAVVVGIIIGGASYKFFCMYKKPILMDEELDLSELVGRWREKGGTSIWTSMYEDKIEELNRSVYDFSKGGLKKKPDKPKMKRLTTRQIKNKAQAMVFNIFSHVRSEVSVKGALPNFKAKLSARSNKSARSDRTSTSSRGSEMVHMMSTTRSEGLDSKSAGFQTLDGLCSPCEDPDICLTCMFCPMCRMADTVHTLGDESRTFWKAYLAYSFCPCCWPCLCFFSRLYVRSFFKIPFEPHRDCLVYCCCCCCCGPCASCQEARLVDAPIFYQRCKKKTHQRLGLIDADV